MKVLDESYGTSILKNNSQVACKRILIKMGRYFFVAQEAILRVQGVFLALGQYISVPCAQAMALRLAALSDF